jgi:hypothetical protein
MFDKPFVTATLKAKVGDHTQFWHVVALSETVQAELMHLSDGDAVGAPFFNTPLSGARESVPLTTTLAVMGISFQSYGRPCRAHSRLSFTTRTAKRSSSSASLPNTLLAHASRVKRDGRMPGPSLTGKKAAGRPSAARGARGPGLRNQQSSARVVR